MTPGPEALAPRPRGDQIGGYYLQRARRSRSCFALPASAAMAWTKYQLFLTGLMLVTGSINTLSAK